MSERKTNIILLIISFVIAVILISFMDFSNRF